MEKNEAAALALMLTIPEEFVPVVILTLAELVVAIGNKEVALELLPKSAHDLVIHTCSAVMQSHKARNMAKNEAAEVIRKAMS